MHSPACPPPANGQRRGCLWDAYAARLANGEWRCRGRHHLAHRGSSRYGDGHAATRRAVTRRRNLGALSSFRCLLLCADGFTVVRWEVHVRAVGKVGTGGIPAGCITGGCLPPSGSFPLSSSHCPHLTSSLLVNSCSAEWT